MTILAVSDRADVLKLLTDTLIDAKPGAEVLGFDNSPAAWAEARARQVDVAFLEMALPELNGLDLGRYLKELNPLVNLVYLSDGRDGACDAFELHASGYLLKLVDADGVRRELDDLRYPEAKKRVFAQTFGNFELFVDGEPVQFKYNRTKEVVALLVNNRGAQTTNGEIIASLWEDDGDPEKKRSYLANIRQDLNNTLTRLRLNGLIVKQRGSMGIAADRIECDLYDWLAKRQESRYRYLGEYMNQYSWAEYVHAELDEISYAMEDEELE